MFAFTTQRPTKQGTKYGLNLGQNDGPYLAKDSMSSNTSRSVQMFTGSIIAKSSVHSVSIHSPTSQYMGRDILGYSAPKVYDDQLGIYTNYDETHKAQLTASESLGINSSFQHVNITEL